MASWAAVLALSGFHYSSVTGVITFRAAAGRYFWSSGWAWGTCELVQAGRNMNARLAVKYGRLKISRLALGGLGESEALPITLLTAGQEMVFEVRPK